MNKKLKFNSEQSAEIVKMYEGGMSAKAIGKMYGSQPQTITAILLRGGIVPRSVSDRNRLYSLDTHIFDSIDTEAKAYWLGYLFADGNVSGGRIVRVYVAESDREIAVKFKEFMGSEAPIRDFTVNTNKKWGARQSNINMTDLYLGHRLNDLGIIPNRKHDGVSWQVCFHAVPKELQHHWVRGWFDGDGSAWSSTRGPVVSFCGPEGLLTEIRGIIAQEKGTNPHLVICKNKDFIFDPIYGLYYAGRNVAKAAAEFLYRDAHVYLQRKKDVVDQW